MVFPLKSRVGCALQNTLAVAIQSSFADCDHTRMHGEFNDLFIVSLVGLRNVIWLNTNGSKNAIVLLGDIDCGLTVFGRAADDRDLGYPSVVRTLNHVRKDCFKLPSIQVGMGVKQFHLLDSLTAGGGEG